MAQLTVELINRLGLHARAAAKFVHTTSRFSAQVLVRHNDEEVNGKSIMGILMLGAEKDSLIVIEAEGDVHLKKGGELGSYMWWDMKSPTPVYDYVRVILNMLHRKT
jgi:phosphocarrier protein HPr